MEKKSVAVNFFLIGFDDFIPIHWQSSHHRPHEIQNGYLSGSLGLRLKGFRDVRDDDGLIGLIGGE